MRRLKNMGGKENPILGKNIFDFNLNPLVVFFFHSIIEVQSERKICKEVYEQSCGVWVRYARHCWSLDSK